MEPQYFFTCISRSYGQVKRYKANEELFFIFIYLNNVILYEYKTTRWPRPHSTSQKRRCNQIWNCFARYYGQRKKSRGDCYRSWAGKNYGKWIICTHASKNRG